MTDSELRTVLADRLSEVQSRIAAACTRAGRDPAGVTVVAVTKTVSPRVARQIVELGVVDLGENRPQELWRKAESLSDRPIRWHLIGHLQRNKVERTLPLVHLVHSVDSPRLLDAIAAEGSRHQRFHKVLLQVNISREGQKQGFEPDQVLAQGEMEGRHVLVTGFMGMAALSDDAEQARSAFRELRMLRDRAREQWTLTGPQIEHLSMGMSGDFEVAVEEGATHVRIGSTLFHGLEAE